MLQVVSLNNSFKLSNDHLLTDLSLDQKDELFVENILKGGN